MLVSCTIVVLDANQISNKIRQIDPFTPRKLQKGKNTFLMFINLLFRVLSVCRGPRAAVLQDAHL